MGVSSCVSDAWYMMHDDDGWCMIPDAWCIIPDALCMTIMHSEKWIKHLHAWSFRQSACVEICVETDTPRYRVQDGSWLGIGWLAWDELDNTNLVLKGTLAHCLHQRTTWKIQRYHRGSPKWPMGSNSRFLGAPNNPRRKGWCSPSCPGKYVRVTHVRAFLSGETFLRVDMCPGRHLSG